MKPLLAATTLALAATLSACSSTKSDSSSRSDHSATANGPPREAKVMGSSSAKGDFPATLAHATIEKPAAIKLKVTPTPAYKTRMSWNMACRRGRSAGNTQGQYSLSAPSTQTLKAPMKNSDTCEVSASAQMLKRGTIKVEIIG
jgi:maltose-binding protein MalE